MSARELLPRFVLDALRSTDTPPSDADLTEVAETLAMLALAPVPVPAASSDALRARLVGALAPAPERCAPFQDRLAVLFDLSVEKVREVLARIDDPRAWGEGPIPRVKLMHFEGGPAVAAADNGLVHLEAGVRFPLHRHLGTEEVIVIEGGYEDSSGRVYLSGDRHVMAAGSEHSYTVLPTGRCIFAVSLLEGIEVVE